MPGVRVRPSRVSSGTSDRAHPVEDLVQAVLGVGPVVGAGVEELQFLGGHVGLRELPGRVADGQRQLDARPLPRGGAEQAAAQIAADPVERVVAASAPAQRLLLPAPGATMSVLVDERDCRPPWASAPIR